MDRREFKGAAAPLQLAADIDSTATTFTVTGTPTGWPTGTPGPFVVRIGSETSASAEKVLCSSRTGTTFTVAVGGRGYDGTAATSHSAGDEVAHVWDATSAQNVHDHAADTGRDDHSQYIRADGTRGFTGLSAIAGTPLPSLPGDAGSAGVSNLLARSDHVHLREPWATSASQLAIDSTASPGTITRVAREDHVHQMPGWAGTGGTWGVDSRPARADHTHAASQLTLKVKTADQTNSTTTLANDNMLYFSPQPNTLYICRWVLWATTTGNVFKATVLAPPNASGKWQYLYTNSYPFAGPPTPADFGTAVSAPGVIPSYANAVEIVAYVGVGADIGNGIILQWAIASSGTATVRAGSYLMAVSET